jgi:putative oxidoreductase
MMGSLGLRRGRRNALAASATETIGGAMLVAGAFAPLAAASLIGTMISAIRAVHLKNGVWNAKGGYEFNLVLVASLLALVDGAPGGPSVDRALGLADTGQGWALAALGAGIAGSSIVIEQGKRQPPVLDETPAQASNIPEPAPMNA